MGRTAIWTSRLGSARGRVSAVQSTATTPPASPTLRSAAVQVAAQRGEKQLRAIGPKLLIETEAPNPLPGVDVGKKVGQLRAKVKDLPALPILKIVLAGFCLAYSGALLFVFWRFDVSRIANIASQIAGIGFAAIVALILFRRYISRRPSRDSLFEGFFAAWFLVVLLQFQAYPRSEPVALILGVLNVVACALFLARLVRRP
jgi:hypothetical protein